MAMCAPPLASLACSRHATSASVLMVLHLLKVDSSKPPMTLLLLLCTEAGSDRACIAAEPPGRISWSLGASKAVVWTVLPLS
jgi:hypothetical protein